MNNPPDFICQFADSLNSLYFKTISIKATWACGVVEDGLSVSAVSLCAAAPSHQKKIGEGLSVIEGATISDFGTFLKINKSKQQFLLQLTLFYPIYG